jgi:hypothetical protein
LFFKHICDVWDEEHEGMLAEYGEDFADEHRFQVPKGCHCREVREKPVNVGTALQNAMRGIEAANQKHLYLMESFDQNSRKTGLKRSSVDRSGEPAPEIVNGRAERTGRQPTANGGLQERGVGALECFLLD